MNLAACRPLSPEKQVPFEQKAKYKRKCSQTLRVSYHQPDQRRGWCQHINAIIKAGVTFNHHINCISNHYYSWKPRRLRTSYSSAGAYQSLQWPSRGVNSGQANTSSHEVVQSYINVDRSHITSSDDACISMKERNSPNALAVKLSKPKGTR